MIVQEGQEQYLPLCGGLEDGLQDQDYEPQDYYSQECKEQYPRLYGGLEDGLQDQDDIVQGP